MKHSETYPLLIILISASLTILVACPSDVLAATPSVPEFTVNYVDHSYDVPITHWTTTDPYTGNQITHSSGGEHVDNRTVDVTITNQQFSPYVDSSNNTVQLYYNIRSKGHFENWGSDTDLGSHGMTGLQASSSTYTVVSFNIEYWNVAQGGQIDFEVEAVTGFTVYNAQSCGTQYQTTVGNSGWSNAQTVTIGTPSPATTPTTTIWTPIQPTFNPYNPTATPSPPQNPIATPIQPGTQTGTLFGFDWVQTTIIAMAIVIAVLVIALVAVTWRRSTNN